MNEEKYKAYKTYLNRLSGSYFSNKMLQYKNNMKKTWSEMKEIIRKTHQHNKSKLPRKLFVDKKYITLETEIAKKFNELFTEIGLLQEIFLLRVSPLKVSRKNQYHLT